MKFDQTLQEGTFLKRYKRFFTDIDFNGETIVAHCPNTGSMMGLKDEGNPCLFSTTDDPKRKLKHTLQMIKVPTSWVGVNTGLPNKLVMELFLENPLPHWKKFDKAQAEVKISDKSRIDMVLWNSEDHDVKKWSLKNLSTPLHLIEIKNVTLAEDGIARFPDAVTTRGQKHLDEMMELISQGYTCEMVYVIQRSDCEKFETADDIDPDYGEKLRAAKKMGLTVTPIICDLSPKEVRLSHKVLKS